MSGISSAVRHQTMASFLPILVRTESYNIDWHQFKKSATDEELLRFTNGVLDSFWRLEKAINQVKSIKLDAEICQKEMKELAKWGLAAYRRFFEDERSRQIIEGRCKMMGSETPAPTFISERVLFPWEVLYAGDNYQEANPEMFWGLRYTPARILTPEKDISRFLAERTTPLDMMFCLHHGLREAHKNEWLQIQKLIRSLQNSRCSLLSAVGKLTGIESGENLLDYFIEANHNILHFACHCLSEQLEVDTLLFSMLKDEGQEGEPLVIQLGTIAFILVKEDKQFQCQPLVFLNACQSAGGTDALRKTFNLPQMFIKRGAEAVIATACPVPDRFAAAFAQQFYTFFIEKQMTIGEALQATRKYFIEEYNNPLGLAYGLYSPAYYRLTQPLATVGVAS
ncbi:CHAT domain-containing protein [Scytonema sp. UIC 10036]|uniref:CHAT domain-containing protein n=1 Tax=Scytonema sp. UIC 10036 TaxID=2304196 RepID=UPI0012DA8B20|nr:CHAT domain-containing protein [Scytonema sp. UIC 10036]MUG93183.1 CHAT domain-containing protein [Scytonema sp. UIC 10036]